MVRVDERFLREITVLAKDGYNTVNGTNARFINAADPINDQDLVTKLYLDNNTGTGTVHPLSTSTDNAIVKWHNTDGYTVQNTGIIIDDSNNITGINSINAVDGYFSNNVIIEGKLTVDGLIDPTGLVLVSQGSVPGGNPTAGNSTIWIRNSDGYLISTDENGNNVVINGLVPGDNVPNRMLQSNSNGTGVDYSIIESSLSSVIEDDGQRHIKRNDTVIITDYPYSASGNISSTTGSINNGSVNLTLTNGSTFLYNHGLVIRGAGSDHGLATPDEPIVVQQGTTGASTVEVKVVAATRHRGYTIASDTTTIVNAAATFTKTNWLGVWPNIIPGAAWYLIYLRRNGVGNFTLRKVVPGQLTPGSSDDFSPHLPVAIINSELTISNLYMFPLIAPVAAQANYLRARVVSGGGTNNITIDTEARTSVSGLNVYHDDWVSITDALNSYPSLVDFSSSIGGDVEIPRGEFPIWDDLRIRKISSLKGRGGNWTSPISQIRPADSLYGLSVDHLMEAPQWTPGIPVRLGDRLRPARYWNNINYIWVCTTAGITGTTYPTFVYTLSTTINDGTVVWTCYSNGINTAAQSILKDFGLKPLINDSYNPLIPGAFEVAGIEIVAQSQHSFITGTTFWTPGLSLINNRYVIPSDGYETGFRYKVSGTGTSGLTEPVWGKVNGGTTVDNGVNLIAEWQPIIWGAAFLISAQMTATSVSSMFHAGWAWYLNGKIYSTGTNTNGALFNNCSGYSCGGGIYIEGTDSSISSWYHAFIGLCGPGLVDLSFYGGRFNNCYWDANYRGPQNGLQGIQSCCRFDGCYWEDTTTGNGGFPDHYLYRPAHGSGGVIGSGTLLQGTMIWEPAPGTSGVNLYTEFKNHKVAHPLHVFLAWPTTIYQAFYARTESDGVSKVRGDFSIEFDYNARTWNFGNKDGSSLRIPLKLSQGSGQGDIAQMNTLNLGNEKNLLSYTDSVPASSCYNVGDIFLWSGPGRFAIKNKTRGGYVIVDNDGYWQSSTHHFATPSSVIRNTTNTHLFVAITTGTSGLTEPVWNTTTDTITEDGGIEWICWSTVAVPQWIAQSETGTSFRDVGNTDVDVIYSNRRIRINETYTADRSVNLLATNAIEGDLIEILRTDTNAFVANVKNWDTSLLLALTAPNSAEFMFDGTNWIISRI